MTGNKEKPGRYCIIHGHFYQPPRENPWLDIIETQPSAAPAHDWNERVYNDCYRPNAYSRILDSSGMIAEIRNNYRHMSFNFGPTLFRWLEDKHPDVAERIIAADMESCERLDGHGNAMAQVYNHIILPLANRRDTITQIRWAREFFLARFKRQPEGMWLSETAINSQTVECLIEEGIRFVVLAPSQAESIRPLHSDAKFSALAPLPVDTRRPYRILSPGTGHLDVFFFNERLSKEASFGGLLNDANSFAANLSAQIDPAATVPQAVVLATDGETFGHHKPFADMCLAYFFAHASSGHDISPVNFAWFLDRYPPQWEVKIKNASGEGTAWSCAHGTGRWSRDCGCSTGGRGNWNQKWRAPLRLAFDSLQKRIDARYESFFGSLIPNPWSLRDRLVELIDSRDIMRLKKIMLESGAPADMTETNLHDACSLLEAQKYMLFAYTSCGWFFADIGGIEAVQNLLFACRALQLGLFGAEYEKALREVLDILDTAVSNDEGKVTGKDLFLRHAMPFLKYRELLSFSVALELGVSSSEEIQTARFGNSVHAKKISMPDRKQIDVFTIRMTEQCRGENRVYSVCISGGYSEKTLGCVLPFDAAHDIPGFDASDCEAWESHPQCVKLLPGDVFVESRAIITSRFTAKLDGSTTGHYSAWMKSNEKMLGAIAVLNGSLPAFLREPVAYLVTARWNEIASALSENGRESEVFAKFNEIKQQSKLYGVNIDFSASARLLNDLLGSQLRRFSESLTVDTCDRMRYLLNIVDTFSVPVPKHNLEDAFYPILCGPVADLYRELAGKKNADPEKKAFLAALLSFARRMNFCIERFPL
jgi:hypothetical protein